MKRAAIVLWISCFLVKCTSPSGDSFEERLEAGTSCGELFEMRNELDSDDPRIPEMNEDLQEIGCYSSSSTRTDQ